MAANGVWRARFARTIGAKGRLGKTSPVDPVVDAVPFLGHHAREATGKHT